jgi:microcystin-dependent protein
VGYNILFNYINGGASTAAASQSGSETPNGNQTTYNGSTGGSLADAKGSVNASNQATITIDNKSAEAASDSHNNMQPFLVLNFIIKA